MPRRPETILYDIRSAISDVEEFPRGRGRQDFMNDRMLQAAAERKLEIAGEAIRRLRSEFPEIAALISGCEKIAGFRNVLAHGYDVVSSEVVWDVVVNHLPALKRDIEAINL
ncbi:MAG TPA: antitoxin [candidate division Zixibacteria bacterium]|jgi:uncharacterized protein with HEPN domain|nr:antitoxin [candidate division Zixibacteria bacterium]